MYEHSNTDVLELTSRAHLPPIAAAIPCKANTILSGKVASAIDLELTLYQHRQQYMGSSKSAQFEPTRTSNTSMI